MHVPPPHLSSLVLQQPRTSAAPHLAPAPRACTSRLHLSPAPRACTPRQVARADGNGTKKHTTMMAPATATLAFLETKLRASKCGLLDDIHNHVGVGQPREVSSVGVGQQAACGPVLVGVVVGGRQPRGEHAASLGPAGPALAAPSWPSSYREQFHAPALAALAAVASCGEGELGGPRAPDGGELGAPAEAVSSDGGVEHTGAGALVDASA